MANRVSVNTTNNEVRVTPNQNTVTVNTTSGNVTVTNPGTEIVTVNNQGPTGPAGPQGPAGPTGSIDTSAFATTGSNVFIGDQTITGSLLVSGSSTFTNIGPAIFSGSVDITGGLTASVASSSFATTAQTSSNSVITHDVSGLNQYLTTVANISNTVLPIQTPDTPILYSPQTVHPFTGDSGKGATLNWGNTSPGVAAGILLAGPTDQPNYLYSFNGDLIIQGGTSGTKSLILSGSGINAKAHITGTIDNADKVYVDANDTSTSAFQLPMYQPTAGGGGYVDGYYQLKNPINEVFYYARATNPITQASQGSDYIQIGGAANTAGGIFLNSTVGVNPFIYSNFGKVLIQADDRFEANNPTYPAALEISTYTGSFADNGVANYISLESTELQFTGSLLANDQSLTIGGVTASGIDSSGDINTDGNIIITQTGDELQFTNDSVGIQRDGNALKLGGYDGIRFTAALTNINAQAERLRISSDGNISGSGNFTINHITSSGNISASGDITTNALTAAGLIYPTTDGTDGQAIITDGAGNLSFGHGEKLHLQVRNDDSVDITAGTPIYSTGEIGGSERIKVRIAQASDASKMPAIGIVETTLTTTGGTKDGFAIINGIYNTNITPVSGNPALGDNIYVHADGGVTTIKPSGSNLIQNIGTVLKTNGTVIQGMKVSSIDRTNDVPNLLDNTIFFGSGSDQTQQIHISGALDQTIINNITASGNISASGQIIGDVVDTSFENFLNFEAATSYTYIAPFPLTVNFTGSSTSSMEVVGFVTASANTDTFSVQQGLPITLNRFDKLKITPSSSGLFTFSGSRTI